MAAVVAFTDFLNVAIHSILYCTIDLCIRKHHLSSPRNTAFVTVQNRHPAVCKYIEDIVDAVKEKLSENLMSHVVLLFFQEEHCVRERYVFDVEGLSRSLSALKISWSGSPSGEREDQILPSVDLEQPIRAALNVLEKHSKLLDKLPMGCSFTVAVELPEAKLCPLRQLAGWIHLQRPSKRAYDGTLISLPLRYVRAGIVEFQILNAQCEVPKKDGPPMRAQSSSTALQAEEISHAS